MSATSRSPGRSIPSRAFSSTCRRSTAALETEVRDRFDHSNINLDVPEFADGKLMPTGENLARFICERVQASLGNAARVTRVVIAEDPTLSAVYEPPPSA